MKLRIKRIIAREFLILMVCFRIALLTFLGIYLYNFLERNKVDNLSQEIALKRLQSDSLSKSYKEKTEKQFWLTDKFTSKFDLSNQEYTNDKIWKRLYAIAKSDSVKYKWKKDWDRETVAFNKELGFETPEKFQAFIIANMGTSKDINAMEIVKKIDLEADVLQQQLNEVSSKIVSTQNQFKTAALAFIIAVIILFISSFIFYAISWSIKTLKQA